MPKIKVLPHAVFCPDGIEFEAQEGQSICDELLKNGVEIEHACDGAGACATCHVIIRQGFLSIEEPGEQEEDTLDKAWGLTDQSRLSCQAVVGSEDLTIEIPRYTINHAAERKK